MARLIVMCGLSFSGKTTLAEAIVRRLGARLVSLDGINDERGLRSGGDGLPAEAWAETLRIAKRRVAGSLAGGQDVVVDDTACFRWIRDDYRALGAEQGGATSIVLLDVPVEEIRRRRESNDRDPRRRPIREEIFDSHRRGFEFPDPDETVLRFCHGDSIDRWLDEHFPG